MSVDDLGFNPAWLTERFPFDSKARNQEVESACLDYLASFPTPVIVDLGCGNGANTKYFIDRIPSDHTWILVDNDQRLLNHALESLTKAEGYQITNYKPTEGLTLTQAGKQVSVKTACGSLLELDQLLDLTTVHLLMANAVFDLFSEDQFIGFSNLLKTNRLPFLATLNYSSMHFVPASETDELFVGYYEAHMQREQAFGRGMGKRCSEVMEQVLRGLSAQMTVGPSTWNIGSTDLGMLNFLYHYLDDSLHELPLTDVEGLLLDGWLADKRRAIDGGGIGIRVGHCDLFARF